MNIGDKVRLLHGTEEGRILRFKDNNIVEIEIEDGFVIPVMRKEIVIVAEEESKRFRTSETPSNIKSKSFKPISEGIFLAYLPSGHKNFRVYLINSSDFEVLFSISSLDDNQYMGLFSGKAEPHSAFDLGEKFISWIEIHAKMHAELIFHNLLPSSLKSSLQIDFRIQSAKLLIQQKNIPILEKPGFYVQLDNKEVPVNVEALRAHLSGDAPRIERPAKNGPVRTGSTMQTVDLHIEMLMEDSAELSKNEIFETQIKTFEKAIDHAIASGVENLKIIHGIGNGALRNYIHKYLSKNDQIKYFEDADKGRFGFGATLIHL